MIDFVNIQFRNKEKYELEDNILLLQNLPEPSINRHKIASVNQTIDSFTEEKRSYPLKGKIQNMNINCYENSSVIQNSIHKLHNLRLTGREHNYNELTFSQTLDNLNYLKHFFPKLPDGKLTRLEFGFNLYTREEAQSIITKNLLMHKFKDPSRYRRNSTMCYKEFTHSNYDIKVYDKAKQYKRPKHENILRFEIRFKSKGIHELGIYTVRDLYRKNTYRKLFIKSMKRFDELQIVDQFNALPTEQYNKLIQFSNPHFWSTFNNRQTRSRYTNAFHSLLIENDLLQTKQRIRNLLQKNFIKLINN
ncbi:hypothetical protein NE848_09150 [Gramella jeungdoensis]|uniref:Replication initiation protein n=1 Tax=Gramella jeungdoensis TaxID=708091 RepID=A0ABT0Z1E3_9FLAO|nr:hypothetical protein [Gramella jeungdoensis]MCM8569546.1 hypothetical protein [Gramella jeungdoensis]